MIVVRRMTDEQNSYNNDNDNNDRLAREHGPADGRPRDRPGRRRPDRGPDGGDRAGGQGEPLV